MKEYGYIIALDDTAPSRVHALTVGKFKHPVYGNIDITPERITRFAASVNDKVRGIDPDIDYEHKANGGKAAGWVTSAAVENDGKDLFLSVEWTDPAKAEIEAKQWRYFSPEFADSWEDADGTAHPDVIMGGGLTNRPFLKNLAPLNFNEFYVDVDVDLPIPPIDTSKGGNELDPKKLAELLGSTEDDEAKLLDEVKSLVDFKATKQTVEEAAKTFAEQYPEQAKKLQELENTNKLMETDTRIKQWSESGLPPVLYEDVDAENKSTGLREFRMSLSKDDAAKFDEIIAKIVAVGMVPIKADESGGNADPTAGDGAEKFEQAIKQFQEDDKLSYADAVKAAANANPELAKAYMKGVS